MGRVLTRVQMLLFLQLQCEQYWLAGQQIGHQGQNRKDIPCIPALYAIDNDKLIYTHIHTQCTQSQKDLAQPCSKQMKVDNNQFITCYTLYITCISSFAIGHSKYWSHACIFYSTTANCSTSAVKKLIWIHCGTCTECKYVR